MRISKLLSLVCALPLLAACLVGPGCTEGPIPASGVPGPELARSTAPRASVSRRIQSEMYALVEPHDGIRAPNRPDVAGTYTLIKQSLASFESQENGYFYPYLVTLLGNGLQASVMQDGYGYYEDDDDGNPQYYDANFRLRLSNGVFVSDTYLNPSLCGRSCGQTYEVIPDESTPSFAVSINGKPVKKQVNPDEPLTIVEGTTPVIGVKIPYTRTPRYSGVYLEFAPGPSGKPAPAFRDSARTYDSSISTFCYQVPDEDGYRLWPGKQWVNITLSDAAGTRSERLEFIVREKITADDFLAEYEFLADDQAPASPYRTQAVSPIGLAIVVADVAACAVAPNLQCIVLTALDFIPGSPTPEIRAIRAVGHAVVNGADYVKYYKRMKALLEAEAAGKIGAGGLYYIRDRVTGAIVYIGRTIDYATREVAHSVNFVRLHARKLKDMKYPVLGTGKKEFDQHFRFEKVKKKIHWAWQEGCEQVEFMSLIGAKYSLANGVSPIDIEHNRRRKALWEYALTEADSPCKP